MTGTDEEHWWQLGMTESGMTGWKTLRGDELVANKSSGWMESARVLFQGLNERSDRWGNIWRPKLPERRRRGEFENKWIFGGASLLNWLLCQSSLDKTWWISPARFRATHRSMPWHTCSRLSQGFLDQGPISYYNNQFPHVIPHLRSILKKNDIISCWI